MTEAGLEKPLEKLVLHSFLEVHLWRGKILYRIPRRRICSDNNDVWPGTRWYCTSSEQTSNYELLGTTSQRIARCEWNASTNLMLTKNNDNNNNNINKTTMALFACLVGFLTSSSTTCTRFSPRWAPRQSIWIFYELPHMRQSWETWLMSEPITYNYDNNNKIILKPNNNI